MPRRIEDYRGLTQISRVRLLHAVQRQPGRRLQELAESAGIHVNTARDHLRVLESEGLIVSAPESTGTRGRPPTVYVPVTDVDENPAARRRAEQAQEQGDKLRKYAPDLDRSSELGGDALHQIDTLYTHLEDVGMQPELDEGALTIDLEPCPFAGMIESERNVVCSVHATLVQHHLAQVSGPLKLGKLSPFVTPEVCRIALRHKQDAGVKPTGGASSGRGASRGASRGPVPIEIDGVELGVGESSAADQDEVADQGSAADHRASADHSAAAECAAPAAPAISPMSTTAPASCAATVALVSAATSGSAATASDTASAADPTSEKTKRPAVAPVARAAFPPAQ